VTTPEAGAMGGREFHPLASHFPLLKGPEFEALVADIAANGLLEPIVLHEDAILDGRNRYRACLQAGVEPRFEQYAGDDPLAFVVSKNLHRRHLTASQRAILAAKLLPAFEAQAKERQRKAGERYHRGSRKVPARLPEPFQERAEAREVAAKLLNVGSRYVQDAKKLAAEAPELAERVRAGELTIPQAKRLVNTASRMNKIVEAEREAPPLENVGQRFGVVYADPPWRYEHPMSDSRRIENQYPTMSLDDICALPVAEIATPDAILFLWATSPKLEEAMRVIRHWGFTYRTSLVWVKDRIGMGYYARSRHELLLIATRGDPPAPPVSARQDSVIEAPRQGHSRKPDAIYSRIETMYPDLSKIELFARNARPGWTVWGNEV